MLKNRNILSALIALIVVAAGAFLLWPEDECCAVEAVQTISPAQYQSDFVQAEADHLLIDVRTPQEFASGHIAGAINIPVESLQSRLGEIPGDQTVVVYCRSGNRSATASSILADAGYSSIYDLGGILAWTAAGLPVQ